MVNIKWYDDGEPDFVNEKGVKWWHVDLLTTMPLEKEVLAFHVQTSKDGL